MSRSGGRLFSFGSEEAPRGGKARAALKGFKIREAARARNGSCSSALGFHPWRSILINLEQNQGLCTRSRAAGEDFKGALRLKNIWEAGKEVRPLKLCPLGAQTMRENEKNKSKPPIVWIAYCFASGLNWSPPHAPSCPGRGVSVKCSRLNLPRTLSIPWQPLHSNATGVPEAPPKSRVNVSFSPDPEKAVIAYLT